MVFLSLFGASDFRKFRFGISIGKKADFYPVIPNVSHFPRSRLNRRLSADFGKMFIQQFYRMTAENKSIDRQQG